jgi:hypothetical protein
MHKSIYMSVVIVIIHLFGGSLHAQSISNNGSPVSLEHNVLFKADQRYRVSQTGPATFNLSVLFDGAFHPDYPQLGPSIDNPHTILIENLPRAHVQRGAWVGWTTRYWHAQHFEIWGYEEYYDEGWIKVAEETANTSYYYLTKLPRGAFTKIKFVFYQASGRDGRIGLSEIYYIHPEIARPYDGLMPHSLADLSDDVIHASEGMLGIGTTNPEHNLHIAQNSAASAALGEAPAVLMLEQSNDLNWSGGQAAAEILFKKGGDIIGAIRSEHTRNGGPHSYEDAGLTFHVAPAAETPTPFEAMRIDYQGNVGIGTSNPQSKLAVNGTITAKEIKVTDGGWADFVLEDNYKLTSLKIIESFIKKHKHLPDIPSAKDVEQQGIAVSEMLALQMQKIEELTLHLIELKKENEGLKVKNTELEKRLFKLEAGK